VSRTVLLLLPTLLLSTGCRDGAGPETPTMTGAWSTLTVRRIVTLRTTESDGQVSGTGSISTVSATIPISVKGTHAHPSIVLTAQSPGYNDFIFSGRFASADSIVGTLNGSGFQDDSISLRRAR
jgi:hypothetical protein